MSQLRIAMVTSRFWPISGMPQILAGDLAIGLQEKGNHVEVITSRWEHRWGKIFLYQGVPVHRLPAATAGPWGNFRTQRALSKHMTNGEWDAVILFGIEEHFEVVTKSLSRSRTKVILRLDDSVETVALVAQKLTRKVKGIIQCLDQIVCTNQALYDLMIQADVSEERLHLIPDGVPESIEPGRSVNQQNASRLALSDAHPVLVTDPTEPLVLTGVPLEGDNGIHDLIDAWVKVVNVYPLARLWIIGDGPQGRSIWSQITRSSLVYSVIMPGFFDNLDDVFLASDFYVHPARGMTGHATLSRAMASGLGAVSTDNLRGLIKDQINGTLVPAQDPKKLAKAMLQLIEDGNLKNRLGMAAMDSLRHCLMQNTIHQYDQLIRQASSCEQVQ